MYEKYDVSAGAEPTNQHSRCQFDAIIDVSRAHQAKGSRHLHASRIKTSARPNEVCISYLWEESVLWTYNFPRLKSFHRLKVFTRNKAFT